MIGIYEIRKQNFNWLFEQYKDSLWRDDPTVPNRGMLMRFAERIGENPRYLSHVINDRRNIGEELARSMERALHLPEFWMDQDHTGINPVTPDEREFVDSALRLFRKNASEAQSALLKAIAEKLQDQQT